MDLDRYTFSIRDERGGTESEEWFLWWDRAPESEVLEVIREVLREMHAALCDFTGPGREIERSLSQWTLKRARGGLEDVIARVGYLLEEVRTIENDNARVAQDSEWLKAHPSARRLLHKIEIVGTHEEGGDHDVP